MRLVITRNWIESNWIASRPILKHRKYREIVCNIMRSVIISVQIAAEPVDIFIRMNDARGNWRARVWFAYAKQIIGWWLQVDRLLLHLDTDALIKRHRVCAQRKKRRSVYRTGDPHVAEGNKKGLTSTTRTRPFFTVTIDWGETRRRRRRQNADARPTHELHTSSTLLCGLSCRIVRVYAMHEEEREWLRLEVNEPAGHLFTDTSQNGRIWGGCSIGSMQRENWGVQKCRIFF